jgi:hypothetical protein
MAEFLGMYVVLLWIDAGADCESAGKLLAGSLGGAAAFYSAHDVQLSSGRGLTIIQGTSFLPTRSLAESSLRARQISSC